MEEITNLNQIAIEIKEEHAQFEVAVRESLQRALRIGELLIKAKKTVGHGSWSNWVETNCDFSLRSSQIFMRLYAKFPELAKAQQVSHLTYRDAIALLVEPKDTEEVL